MNPSQSQSDDLIPNPPNRVMGAIPDVAKAREAIKELLRQGVEAEDIDLLHGDEGMHRLDPADAELGFLSRFHRTLVELAAVNEESLDLRHHLDDLQAGRFVLMVRAVGAGSKQAIADTLRAYGGEHVGFFGRWAWEALDDTTA